ncbi:MAG: phosphotransferase family protein [Microbacteriaceae bacterium]|nr:phosphotransferase family protein [Microbacteriaceae bacterium]
MTQAVALPDVDQQPLQAYLAEHLGYIGTPTVTRFANGHSNPTYLLAYADRQVVVRSQPPGPKLPKAHAVDREFAIQQSLGDTSAPVPAMLHMCTDPSITGGMFYVMEYMPGRVMNDPMLQQIAAPDRAPLWFAMADSLAVLHSIEPDEDAFGPRRADSSYFARQTSRWTKNYLASDLEQCDAMDEVAAWLAAQPQPTGLVRISHGDFRLGNLVFDEELPVVRAILDWELATTGDPCADLAYSCLPYYFPMGSGRGFGGVEPAELGLPARDAYVERYLAAGGVADAAQLDLFVVLSMFRSAAILAGIQRRAIDGNASNEHAVESGARYRSVAELARDLANGIGS